MYQNSHTLSGTESFTFWDNWEKIKSRINEIRNIGPKYKVLRSKYVILRNRARDVKTGAAEITDSLLSVGTKLNLWEQVVSKINTWLPKWESAESDSDKGVGLLPIVLLGLGGISALAFVAINGLRLIKEYKNDEKVFIMIEDKIISAEQAAGIFKGRTSAGPLAEITQNIGTVAALAVTGILGYTFLPQIKQLVASRR